MRFSRRTTDRVLSRRVGNRDGVSTQNPLPRAPGLERLVGRAVPFRLRRCRMMGANARRVSLTAALSGKDVQHLRINNNDIRTLSVTCSGHAAHRIAEVVLRPHRVGVVELSPLTRSRLPHTVKANARAMRNLLSPDRDRTGSSFSLVHSAQPSATYDENGSSISRSRQIFRARKLAYLPGARNRRCPSCGPVHYRSCDCRPLGGTRIRAPRGGAGDRGASCTRESLANNLLAFEGFLGESAIRFEDEIDGLARLARASSSVAPRVFAPGNSSTNPMYPSGTFRKPQSAQLSSILSRRRLSLSLCGRLFQLLIQDSALVSGRRN